jgi:hypothetical protein
MWDPKTKRVKQTRDVGWLKQMYYKPVEGPIRDLVVSFGDEGLKKDSAVTVEAGEGLNEQSTDEAESELEVEVKVEADESDEGQTTPHKTPHKTRFGRTIRAPKLLMHEDTNEAEDEMGLVLATQSHYEVCLTTAEEKYYESMNEFGLVGAGIGGGFLNTNELHVMKYNQAMASGDKEQWHDAVQEEYERMEHHKVFQSVPVEDVPKGAKVLTSTWAMKKKASGTYRARLNARGYEQIDGEHYDEDSKAAPVVQLATIFIVLILTVVMSWHAILLDVRGAFLHGKFEKDRKIYMDVPQGFERFYPLGVVLLLLKTLYGTKQAAKVFWLVLLSAMNDMEFKRSKVDPCLYYNWSKLGLVLIVSWVDDLLVAGHKDAVMNVKKQILAHFEYDDVGELTKYVGCLVERDKY